MKKRGISNHLDWVIGFGLFLVAVTLIIAGLKPGSQPLHEPDALLDIVERNFLEDTYWSVESLPVQVESHCSEGDGKANQCRNFPFISINKNNANMIDESNGYVPFDISGEDLTLNIPNSDNNNYTIIYSERLTKESGSPLQDVCGHTDCYYGVPKTLEGICDNSNCDNEGINDDSVDNLAIYNYEDLKVKWNYPNIQEFKIEIDGREIGYGDNIPQNIPVYVRQITDFELTEKGELEPIKIRIYVW